ncbi:MAG: PEP-CTERM sorting domain-containing protein [Kiritimatiellae bacterium]|nr:PEP-CTERM sorting domain-containing protein [Kiritimatiellia bacterium]
MKKALVLFFSLIWVTFCQAANVLWNCIGISYLPNGRRGEGPGFNLKYYHYNDEIPSHNTFWIDLYVTCSRSGLTTTLMADPGYTCLTFRGNWVTASPGDVAMESTTRHLPEYFMHCSADNEAEMLSSTPLTVKGIENDLYLMFATGSPEVVPTYYYGWVQLTVTPDEVKLVRSAINLDGDPIVVGTGNVPEPSSLLLLAAGGVILALKRATKFCL